MVPFWLKLLALGALVAALIGWGWVGGKASERKIWQLRKAAQVKTQLEATEHARIVEQALQAKVNDANTTLQSERTKHARIAAALKRDADGLRESIAKFASPRPGDSTTALSERCATTGNLLEAALRTSEACAIQGESVAADLRAVLGAWPK